MFSVGRQTVIFGPDPKLVVENYLRPYVRRKSDLPLYFGQIYAFYFDTTPNTLKDNVNTKSV